ncbi:MAG: Hint domain-containing protein, partial [Rhodospirillales bacterium]|nr:Hint domain-containing protein [Rhodospirillales bacterium]
FHLAGGQATVYGLAEATEITQGGLLTVASGGIAQQTTVQTGGQAILRTGGSAAGALLAQQDGTVAVQGTAAQVQAGDFGLALVEAGGTVASSTIAAEGVLVAFQGATLNALQVDAGGWAVLLPGSTLTAAATGAGQVVTTGVAMLQADGTMTAASTLLAEAIGAGANAFVLSGGLALGGTVAAGGTQRLFQGGTASGVRLAGGVQVVDDDAIAMDTRIEQGGVEYVFAGGTAIASVAANGGIAIVDAGGLSTGLVIGADGLAYVDGLANATTVMSGGIEDIVFSGSVLNDTIAVGGISFMFGTSHHTQVEGLDVVEGTALDYVVRAGGTLLSGYPTALTNPNAAPSPFTDGTVAAGGLEVVFAGAVDDGSTIEAGGTLVILPGATVQTLALAQGATAVTSGVVIFAPPGTIQLAGTVRGLSLNAGMVAWAMAGGVESGVTIGNGALDTIAAGGTLLGGSVTAGGSLSVTSGGLATALAIGPGGWAEVLSGATLAGLTLDGAGTLVLGEGALTTGTIDLAATGTGTSTGAELDLLGSSAGGAVIAGFDAGDTLLFQAIGGTPTVSLTAGNTLQVAGDGTIATVRLDPNQDYSHSHFQVVRTAAGAAVTIEATPTPQAVGTPTGTGVTPAHIPLYLLPFSGGYKIGIQVSLDGGATYRMYEFDTGGTGFYAAYDPATWGATTPQSQAPVINSYASGNTYATQPVTADVTFQTTNGGTIALADATIGMILSAQNPGSFTTQQWNTTLTGMTATPPLQTTTWGDFGMSLHSGLGLAALLPQLGDGLSDGFIVTVGAWPNGQLGQIGDVQVGLSAADIASFTTVTPMQGQSLVDLFPNSGQPTYGEAQISGEFVLNDGTAPPFSTVTGYVVDTGSPTGRIYEGTTLTAEDLAPYVQGRQIDNRTTVTMSGSAAPGAAAGWSLSFTGGDQPGLNQLNTGQSASPTAAGSVNTGLIPFFGYRVMFDLADGLFGVQPLACFAAGTRIATERGEVAVERLVVGDRVRTIGGGMRPVRWIGHRAIDCRCHPDPTAVRPVRIRAHAFGAGMPARDLYLSPDHAVFLEGALIPIRHLVDGGLVAQVAHSRVTYFHVELDGHDVLLADGLPAESYLEVGGRSAFANAGAVVQAVPRFDGAPIGLWEAFGYAPLTITGPIVERIRRRLAMARRQPGRVGAARRRTARGP